MRTLVLICQNWTSSAGDRSAMLGRMSSLGSWHPATLATTVKILANRRVRMADASAQYHFMLFKQGVLGTARRLRQAACAFALLVTLGCQPREANPDLRNFLEPSPTVVIPESPYTLSGTVIEAGAGTPLADVLVEAFRRTTITNESGFYEFQRLGRTDVSFSKDGFEAQGPYGVAMNRPTAIDASLQRVIRAPANQVLTATLFPNDPSFNVSGDALAEMDGWVCGPPCKVVRVAVPLNGRIRARVTWQPSGTDFGLFLAQRIGPAAPHLSALHGASGDLAAEISATAGTDARVYFGRVDYSNPPDDTTLSTDLQFKLTMSISP